MIGGGIYATRAIRNSFALVQVPGVDGVHAFSSSQPIGRTNRRGNLLVPDLLPYYGNRLHISDTDIPIDYVVPNVQMTLAPPYRGGAVAAFPVRRVQRTTGTIRLVSSRGDRAAAFGELTVMVGIERFVSPIGGDGEFYFENLPRGRHRARVTHGEGACALTITVPAVDAPVVDLGALRCTEPDDVPR